MSKAYNKFQARTKSPFKILQVQDKTIVVDENGVLKTISMDCANHALVISPTAPTPSNLRGVAKPLPQHQGNIAQCESNMLLTTTYLSISSRTIDKWRPRTNPNSTSLSRQKISVKFDGKEKTSKHLLDHTTTGRQRSNFNI